MRNTITKTAVSVIFAVMSVFGAVAMAKTAVVTSCEEYVAAKKEFTKNSGIFAQAESEFSSCTLIAVSDTPLDTSTAENVIFDNKNLYILYYSSPAKAESAYNAYINNDIAVIPSFSIKAAGTTTKTYNSWGATYIGSDVMNNYISSLYESESDMPEIKVAVIDTGIEYDHSLFENRIDTANGFDFINSTTDASDDQYHGTHVSGIIVDNTLSNVKIIPYKVLNADGEGTVNDMLYALKEAVTDKADVVNMSLGTPDNQLSSEENIKEIFKSVIDTNKIPVVAASGNISDSFPQGTAFPACMDGVIGVGSFDSSGTIASSSNWDDNGMVDICAPGVSIKSAYLGNKYAYSSGTSMASPHVAAAVAMLKTIYNGYTPNDIETMLTSTATDAGDIGYDNQYGYGRINLTAIAAQDIAKDIILNAEIKGNDINIQLRGGVSNTKIIIAGYNNNVLDDTKITDYSSVSDGSATIPFNSSNYENIKIFLWSSSDMITPVGKMYKLK